MPDEASYITSSMTLNTTTDLGLEAQRLDLQNGLHGLYYSMLHCHNEIK